MASNYTNNIIKEPSFFRPSCNIWILVMLSALLAVQGTCLSLSLRLIPSIPALLIWTAAVMSRLHNWHPLPHSCSPVEGNAHPGSHYSVVQQGLKCTMIIHVLSVAVHSSYESHQAGACYYKSVVLSSCLKCCVFEIILGGRGFSVRFRFTSVHSVCVLSFDFCDGQQSTA